MITFYYYQIYIIREKKCNFDSHYLDSDPIHEISIRNLTNFLADPNKT